MCHILYIERTKGKKILDRKALLSSLLSSDRANNDGMGYLLLKKDRHEVKRGIGLIQRSMDKEDVETIIKNKEVNLGISYSYDTV